jgi:hypothetical protein
MSKVKKECHINVKVMKVILGDAKKLKKNKTTRINTAK